MRMSKTTIVTSLAVLLAASSTSAALRNPQVPVQGTALQQLLNAQGQTINVSSEQRVFVPFAGIGVTQPAANFVASSHADAADLALRSVNFEGPQLNVVFPGAAPPGWFTYTAFSVGVPMVIVQLFDASSAIQGTTSYDYVAIYAGLTFALTDAHGTFHTTDALNADALPHVLAFQGTGAHLTDVWLALESDGDGDFADALFLLQGLAPTPVQRTDWGTLKKQFR